MLMSFFFNDIILKHFYFWRRTCWNYFYA